MRDRVPQALDGDPTRLRSQGVAGAETHDVAEDAHDPPPSSFFDRMPPPTLRGCWPCGRQGVKTRRGWSPVCQAYPMPQRPPEREVKFEVADDFDLPPSVRWPGGGPSS